MNSAGNFYFFILTLKTGSINCNRNAVIGTNNKPYTILMEIIEFDLKFNNGN
jgi:hypothetical protein